jgi:RimJ/RimL family protein N-acetyltransferase
LVSGLDRLTLVETRDAHFAWMLGEAPAPDGLRLPKGGVDTPRVLRWLRRVQRERGDGGGWMLVMDGEVVGLCSHKGRPNAAGEAEIGYVVAPAHRRKGYATRAVALALAKAVDDRRLTAITAETAIGNLGSQRVLIANGFAAVGRSHDEEEGEMIVWRREIPR